MAGSNKESIKLHIAMFPWFAYGHINPFIQLSKKLSSHGIQISFFSIPGNIPRIESALNLSAPNRVIPLSIPPIVGLSPNFDSSSDLTSQTAELLKVALDQMQPQLKTLLSQLKPHIILFDFAHFWLPALASELGIKTINFSIFPASANSYLTIPSRMTDPSKPPTLEDLKKPPQGYPKTSITSMKTFQALDFQYLYQSFHGGPPAFERIMRFIKTCDATIYKSSTEVEGPYIDYIKSQIEKPLFLAGPVAPLPPSGELDEKWESWLGKFPEKSVIFCNFGSESYLDDAQIEQLTLGLELTGMPFFLVLKFESESIDVAKQKLEASLPENFRERVKDRGVVHTGWVQQQHILAHKSVGCFLTHSGISSIVEGIVNDCLLACLPLKADQFMNAKVFCGDLKLGVEVSRRDEDGYFGKEDILEAIKILMLDTENEAGILMRENHNKWRKFFLNQEIEARYVANLVGELQALARQA
ncbi:anthocyanidin-3-O-glucoside rhamnosyltransferase [Beta vulgaris subsp. vulgaris]|uniref:anthocyanidin-3-O-glucoside rhamnosyltransferase n=1 Tax=Beta vulgaris subsp. vulgaris TaxID=3555 RepID=UPI002549632A|nr:anthocyanidin-3-O-glucoside rhamnosyltransferase [Beta vulgaris subsp. vulgaris]